MGSYLSYSKTLASKTIVTLSHKSEENNGQNNGENVLARRNLHGQSILLGPMGALYKETPYALMFFSEVVICKASILRHIYSGLIHVASKTFHRLT